MKKILSILVVMMLVMSGTAIGKGGNGRHTQDRGGHHQQSHDQDQDQDQDNNDNGSENGDCR